MAFKKIGVACDHAGTDLKQMIVEFLQTSEIEYVDFGVSDADHKSVDYPDFAELIATNLQRGTIDAGIAICGTGLGMAITANKFHSIRAVTVTDDYSARMSRSHNDANVICLGARTLNHHRAIDLIKTWIKTPFSGDRHELRVNKIIAIEKKNFQPL